MIDNKLVVGQACICEQMSEAIADRVMMCGVVKYAEQMSPIIGIHTPDGLMPIQYCPWCGNAAMRVVEAE